MSEGYVIGVDHGYAAMKTVHGSFPSGLVAYEHEPYTQKNGFRCSQDKNYEHRMYPEKYPGDRQPVWILHPVQEPVY